MGEDRVQEVAQIFKSKNRHGLQVSVRMKLPKHHSERRLQTTSEKIVQFNEEIIKGQIRGLVLGSEEETLNGLLEAWAEKLPLRPLQSESYHNLRRHDAQRTASQGNFLRDGHY